MLKELGDVYAFIFGWPVVARLNNGLFYLSSRALGFNNHTTLARSGELKIIKERIGGTHTPVIFDVGANVGDWSAAVLNANRLAQIHAFEPQAALAARLVAGYPGITVNNAAVGEFAGELDLYDYVDHPGSKHASLLKGVIDTIHKGVAHATKVPVVTLDEYCREHRVERIHFLKIDVEGFEISVLRGAKEMIAGGKIDAIQFEFNEMNVAARTFLNDFIEYFGNAFSVYRILPHGVLPLRANNHWLNEQYTFQNLLAVKSL